MTDPLPNGSILSTVKHSLGLADDYTAFDVEVIMHINSTFGTLAQLGLGPVDGFMIQDATPTWVDFLGTDVGVLKLNSAKSYMYICVRLLFDSTTLTGPVLDAFKAQKLEYEWRLQVAADPDPIPDSITDDDGDGLILDGGSP